MMDEAARPDEPDPPTVAAPEDEEALAATLFDSPSVSSEERDTAAFGPKPEAPLGTADVSVSAAGSEPGALPVLDDAGGPDAPPGDPDPPTAAVPEHERALAATLSDSPSVSSGESDTAAFGPEPEAPPEPAAGRGAVDVAAHTGGADASTFADGSEPDAVPVLDDAGGPDAPPDEPDPPTGAAPEHEQALAATLSDSPSVSSEESDNAAFHTKAEAPSEPAAGRGAVDVSAHAGGADVSVFAGGSEPGAVPVPDGAGAPDSSPDEDDDPAPEPAPGAGASLLEESGDDFSVSSDGDDALVPGAGAEPAVAALASREGAIGVPSDGNGAPEAGPPFVETTREEMPSSPVAALAFAMDPDTEEALRDGLFHYTGPSPDCDEPQVWPGGLRAAVAALADGYSTRLVFVDIDGVPYPAGAIHELAAVCEVGTVVIAIGSDGTAQPGRELLLAGVSDYLAKPVTAEAVSAAAARASTGGSPASGRVAGFVGPGGSGTTTLAAAAALHAAARGCYVSVLDLDRSVAAAALSLDVEPAAGLDQLLEAAARSAPDPEMVEGVGTRRSDRIEVYAHRWNPSLPAAPEAAALDRMFAVLRGRSQLVLVDGFGEHAARSASRAPVDTYVFVVEPTRGGTADAARMMGLLGPDRPVLFVQNHTRAFKRGTAARVLRDAGIGARPDVVVPFEPFLPEVADRGWPRGRLPRSLRRPMTALTDRLLESAAA